MAHLYHAHYTLLRQLHLHAHLNTLFTHLMVFTSKFDLVPDRETDILLPLFSLLLKNLADPAQNPKLREGLGIGEDELSIFTSKTASSSSSSAQDKPAGEDGQTVNPTSCTTSAPGATEISSGIQISSSASSSPSHLSKGGEGGHDSGMGEEDSISGISSTPSTLSSSMPARAGTPECSRNTAGGGNVSSLSSLNSSVSSSSQHQAGGTTVSAQPDSSRLTRAYDGSGVAGPGGDGNGFLSSSFPPAQHHLFSHQPPASLLSSSSPQKVSNGGSSLALHLPFSCDSRPAMMAHPGHVVDCTNQQAMTSSSAPTRKSPLSAASPMFPHSSPSSSSPPHRMGLPSHQEMVGEEGGSGQRSGSPMVVDVDPTKPPSEWLSSMQVSAT